LQNQDNYSLQKHEFEEYEADLADVTSLSQQNDGIQMLQVHKEKKFGVVFSGYVGLGAKDE
jgi:allophanate hydrolase subunit 1